MNLRRYGLALRRWWWLLILGMVVTGLSGYLISAQQPAIYASTVRVIVGQTLQSVNPDYGSLAASERLVATYAELAQSRTIAERTAAALGWSDLGSAFVVAQAVPDTEFLDLTVQANSADGAAAIANEVANQLILSSPAGPQSPEARILAEVEGQISTVNARILETSAEIEELKDAIEAVGASSADAEPLIAQVQVLQQLQTQDRQTLSTLYSTALGNRSNSLSVVEAAIVPGAPIAPNPLRTAIFLAILGLCVALAFVIALEYLDDTIKTPDEAINLAGAPLLAAIIKQARPNTAAERMVTKLDPRSPAAESFRTLRTNLQFSNIDVKARSLIITSGQPEEGKSTVAANLAWTIAQSGQRVILIDADLRKPMVHKIFEVDNEWGLTSLLSNDEDPDISERAIKNLTPTFSVLPSGPQPPNPSEMLSSKRMEMLVWLFQQEYDWVLFDTPPVLTVTDPVALAPRTDGVLLVAESKRTRRDMLAKSRSALETVGARIIGVAVNKMDQRAEGYYAYYTYYHDQQSGEPETKRWWQRRSRGPETSAAPQAKGGAPESNGYAASTTNGHAPEPEAVSSEELA